MLKIVAFTLSGIVLILIGIIIAYIYLIGVDQGNSPLLLIPSVVLFIIGLTLLYYASKLDSSVIQRPTIQEANASQGLSSILKRNNEISEMWERTDTLRHKLKVLQASGKEI